MSPTKNLRDPLRGVRTWKVGDEHEKDIWVGLDRSRDSLETFPLELLRVGSIDSGQPSSDAFEAKISLVDYGGILGPIDVPFSIVVPGCTSILVKPLRPVTVDTTICARSLPIEDRSDRNFATKSYQGIIGATYPLPAWVRGVGVFDPARFEFLDRAGLSISAALDGAQDRPSLAAFARLTVAGVISFYY
jgi:hypothetical protein